MIHLLFIQELRREKKKNDNDNLFAIQNLGQYFLKYPSPFCIFLLDLLPNS